MTKVSVEEQIKMLSKGIAKLVESSSVVQEMGQNMQVSKTQLIQIQNQT